MRKGPSTVTRRVPSPAPCLIDSGLRVDLDRVLVYPMIARRLPRTAATEALVLVVYRPREGILRTILAACTSLGFVVTGVHTREGHLDLRSRDAVEVRLELEGARTPLELNSAIQNIDGVLEVVTTETAD